MKVAIYIEDGVQQLVLTPQSKYEKNLLEMLRNKKVIAKYFIGSFYECKGGWYRQGEYYEHAYEHPDDVSLIVRLEDEKQT